MSFKPAKGPDGRIILPIPPMFRGMIMKKLRRAYRSDYRWHLQPNPTMDARVKGERELDAFLAQKTTEICAENGVSGRKVGEIIYDLTEPLQFAAWLDEIDMDRSLGTDFDLKKYCPEEADVLPIIYGATMEGSRFLESLEKIFTEWIRGEVLHSIQYPYVLTFNVSTSVENWLDGCSLGSAPPDPTSPTFFQDELLDFLQTRGLQSRFVGPNRQHRRNNLWRCTLLVIGDDIEEGELQTTGYSFDRKRSMEDAAKKILKLLQASVGIDDTVERPPTPN